MKHTISRAALAAVLVLGVASAAAAQSTPPPVPPAPPAPAAGTGAAPPPPAAGAAPPAGPHAPGMPDPVQLRREIRLRFAPDGGARALGAAYRAIGEAEALNGRSPYVAQARSHYAGAYARFRRGDAVGASAEATAAAALARAALDDRPAYVPRGLETPPSPAPRPRPLVVHLPAAPGVPPAPGSPPAGPPPAGMPELPHVPGMMGPLGMPGVAMRPFDASRLQALVALENTAEVRGLADRAAAAAASAQRLAAGDREAARRQQRLAHDLALAVRGITAADHPGQLPGRLPRRPLGAPGTVGTLDLSGLETIWLDLPDPLGFQLPDELMDGLLGP